VGQLAFQRAEKGLSADRPKATRRLKYAQVKAFFNFIIDESLKTTKVYYGKINGTEAIRWIDVLHGK
jgi:hypothetical protein